MEWFHGSDETKKRAVIMVAFCMHAEGIGELCLWGTVGRRRVMPCRAFLLDGLLVDTCHRRGREAFLEWLGVRRVSQAVLTHHHEDHAGNASLLNAQGIVVQAHPLAAAPLAERRPLPFFEWVVWGSPEPTAIIPVPSRIETGRYTFRVVYTPGHTRDHIVLLEEKEGWLFSGDLFLGDRLLYLRRDEDLRQLLASLEKVLALDFGVIFCAHRGRVGDGHTMLARKRDFLRELITRVHELHRAGYGEKEITGRLLGCEGGMTWASLGVFSKRRLVHRILQLEDPPGHRTGGGNVVGGAGRAGS